VSDLIGEHSSMLDQARILLCAALVAVVVPTGCDAPPATEGASAEKAAKETKAAAAEVPAAPKKAAVPYDECLTSCSEGKLSKDDQATCRLNCKADDAVVRRKVGAVESEVTPKPIIVELRGCVQACSADKAADEAAQKTCTDTCLATVSSAASTLVVLQAVGAKGDAPALTACARTCFGAMMGCEGECEGDADSRATCSLNCDEQASVCLSGCGH